MKNEIKALIETIKNDYAKGSWHPSMIEEFNEGIEYSVGKKYIKIITRNSVWGFIVNTDSDKKFRKGDILKAVSWAAPARNHARGNILDGGYTIQWTGPLYMK